MKVTVRNCDDNLVITGEILAINPGNFGGIVIEIPSGVVTISDDALHLLREALLRDAMLPGPRARTLNATNGWINGTLKPETH